MDTIWVYVFLCTCVWCVARVCVRAYVCMNEYTKGFWLENERKVCVRKTMNYVSSLCVINCFVGASRGSVVVWSSSGVHVFRLLSTTYVLAYTSRLCVSFISIHCDFKSHANKKNLLGSRRYSAYVRCVDNERRDLSLNMVFDRLITQEKL